MRRDGESYGECGEDKQRSRKGSIRIRIHLIVFAQILIPFVVLSAGCRNDSVSINEVWTRTSAGSSWNVKSIVWATDEYVITGHDTSALDIWSSTDSNHLFRLNLDNLTGFLSGSGQQPLFAVSLDNSISVYRIKSGGIPEVEAEFDTDDRVSGLALSDDGRNLGVVTSEQQTRLYIWQNLNDEWSSARTYELDLSECRAWLGFNVSFSSSGETVCIVPHSFSGQPDGCRPGCWETGTGTRVTFGNGGPLYAGVALFSSDGGRLVFVSQHVIRVVEWPSLELIAEYHWDSEMPIRFDELAVSRSAVWVALLNSQSSGSSAFLVQPGTGKTYFQPLRSMTNAMSFSSTGRYLGFAQWGGSAPALHLPEGEMKSGFPLRAPALTSLATDPSGSSLYVTRFDGNVTEHNTSNGKDVGELELGDTVQKQAVGDRYYFAAVSNYIGEPEHNMRVLERESGRQAAIRRIDSSRVFDVSHDGKLVVMIDEEKMFASCSWIGEPERFYCKYNLPKSVFADPEIILDAEVLGNGPEVFLVIRKASDSKRQEVIFNTLDGSVRELPGACNKVDENNELWVAAGWSEDGTVLARVVREGYGTEIGFWEASTCQQLNVIELDEPICIYGPKVRKVKISQDNAWAYVDRCRKGEAYLVPVGSEHVPTKLVVDRFAWGSPVFEEDGEQAAGYIAFVSKEGSLACLAIAIGDPMRLKIWLVLLGSVLGLLAGIFVFLKNSRQRRKLVQSMIIHTPEGGP